MATSIIRCKHCEKVVAADEPLIALAESGEGDSSQFITCECGEKITFWGITAQIREQNKPWHKFVHWARSMFNKQVT